VRTWLTDGNELSRLMGVVCGKTLFRVYAQCDPVPSVQSHAALLELAPLLAEQGWDGAEAVLYAARHWGEQPEWLERLFTRSDGNLGELVQLVDAVLPESHDVLADTLKGWLAAENDKAAPGSIVKMAERLQLRMALGTRTPLPDLPEDHTYGLIIVDASSHNRRARNRLAKLASNVIKGLNERNQETLHLLVYRMGQDYPVAGPGEKPSADALIPSGSSPRPRLMGPLLEVHSVQQVSFVLLLTNGSVIDAEDWHDTHWIERIRVYSDVDRSVWFRTDSLIPRQSELEEAEQVIIRNLEQRRGA